MKNREGRDGLEAMLDYDSNAILIKDGKPFSGVDMFGDGDGAAPVVERIPAKTGRAKQTRRKTK